MLGVWWTEIQKERYVDNHKHNYNYNNYYYNKSTPFLNRNFHGFQRHLKLFTVEQSKLLMIDHVLYALQVRIITIHLFITRKVSHSLIIDGSPEQIEKAKTAITPVATPYFEQHTADRDSSVCFLYTEGDSLAERLQGFIKVSPPFPQLVLVNMSGQKKSFCDSKELNEQVVRDFLKQYEENTLSYKDLRK